MKYQSNPPIAVPVSLTAIGILVAYFAHDTVSTIYWLPWLLVFIGVILARWAVMNRVNKSPVLSIDNKLAFCIGSVFINGLVHSSAVFFFPSLSFIERSVITLVLMALTLGAIVTTHGYKKVFLPYATPIVIALAVFWALTPIEGASTIVQIGTAFLMLVFFGMQVSMAASYSKVVKESFAIREERKELNQRLNHELANSIEKEDQLTELNQKLNTALDEAVSASESKTRFLALASHDLRQPIHTLSLFSAALSLRPLDEKSATIAERMETAIGNLATQMDSLLDISKLDAGMVDPELATIDLVAFLERMHIEHKSVAEAEGLELVFSTSANSAAAHTDPELFERVIRNLIGNAIKYTDKGTITVTLDQSINSWKIVVSDTGQGISEKDQAKIFEEFFQVANPERNRTRGLGLGLAIVKRLTQLLSIELSFESSLGQGTSFTLKLAAIEAQDFHQSTVAEVPSIAGLTIICVDDEIAIREALEDLLGAMGCKVFTCRGTSEALALAKTIKPDALLADFRLIGDDSGLKTIEGLRELYPNLPAILVSGDTAPARLQQAKQAGVPMLHKPVSADKLQSTIAEITNTR